MWGLWVGVKVPLIFLTNFKYMVWNYYTPGIYAEGYIVFVFPFACLSIRSWFRHVRGITSKFYVKVSQMGYIWPTTHQKAFVFGA